MDHSVLFLDVCVCVCKRSQLSLSLSLSRLQTLLQLFAPYVFSILARCGYRFDILTFAMHGVTPTTKPDLVVSHAR